MKLYLNARSTNEWDDYVSRIIVVEVPKKRLEWVKRQGTAARGLGASEIRFADCTPTWREGFEGETGEPLEVSEDAEISTDIDEIVISPLWNGDVAFYYSAYFGKDDNTQLQTDLVRLSALPVMPPWEEKTN